MRHSRKSRQMDEVFARLEAEDRAVVYLGKFPPQVALATALSVEWSLATSWEEEQNERILQPREVVGIMPSDMQQLNAALDKIPPNIRSEAAAEQHVFDLLMDFPPDRAWWIAHKIAKWAEICVRMEHTQVFRDEASAEARRNGSRP
jgi:hypothetical protein